MVEKKTLSGSPERVLSVLDTFDMSVFPDPVRVIVNN